MPLCVDLDGTLVKTDTLHESVLVLARKQPLSLLWLPLWLCRGKAAFKREVAKRVLPDVKTLPYREDLLAHLTSERDRGRPIILATAADDLVARAVAAHTGLFSDVLASDGRTNLCGPLKLAALSARFARFDYAGDSLVDVPVWIGAERAIVVGSATVAQRVRRTKAIVEHAFHNPARPIRTLSKAVRAHQWVKNLLVFVPAAAAHCLNHFSVLWSTLLAFVGFSLCASAGYLLNDLFDLEADRADPKKRQRPLASGALSIRAALILCATLLVAGLEIGWSVSPVVALLLGVHFVSTTGYSLRWKRVAVLDVLVLAGLYTLRIFTGAAAADVRVSPWLLGVSMFMFTSLALVKRVSELRALRARGVANTPGRGYQVDDLDIMMVLGGASAYMTVLILALYIRSPDVSVFYAHPDRLWLLCPLLLFWVSRIWLLATRGAVDADPVAFTLKDRASQVVGALVVMVVVAAS